MSLHPIVCPRRHNRRWPCNCVRPAWVVSVVFRAVVLAFIILGINGWFIQDGLTTYEKGKAAAAETHQARMAFGGYMTYTDDRNRAFISSSTVMTYTFIVSDPRKKS